MASFRPSIPNILQPVTDQNGNITKIWWDFLLNLNEKTGGDSPEVPGASDDDISGFLNSRSSIRESNKKISDLGAIVSSLPRSSKAGRRDLLKTLGIDAPSRSVYVDINGSDDTGDGTFLNPFASIEKGITFAKTVTNFDISVMVGQGTYEIDNPFEVPNNIFLIGWDNEGFFPTPKNDAPLFTIGEPIPGAGSEVFFINMRVNGRGYNQSMVKQTGPLSRVFASRCSMRNVAGIGWDCAAGFMSLDDMESSELNSNNTLYKVSGTGKLTIGRTTAIDADITTVFLCDGGDLNVMGPTNIDTDTATVTNALVIDNGGVCSFQNAHIHGAETGVSIDNASDVEMVSVNFAGVATTMEVLDAASKVRFVGGTIDKNTIDFPTGFVGENMLFQDSTEDEEATKIFGDFFVGRPERGTVLCTGEGEPSTRGMMVLTTDNTATSTTDGGNFIDVTDEASSFSGSTFGFQGVTADHTILIASTLSDGTDALQHPGEFILQEAAAVEITPKSFIFEYWNGSAWAEITVMSIEEPNSYRYGNDVFLRTDSREHIRYNADIFADWTKKTINGGDYYWSRIRIATTVTTAPVFQQFRIHANFGEFASDGYSRYYGRARFRTTLLAAGNIYSETGGIANFDLPIGNGGLPTGWTHRGNNQQFNGNGDAIYMQFVLPRGICTASSMRVSMYYIPEQAGPAGDASFIISALPMESQGIMVADPAGGSVPVSRALANTVAITTNAGQATTIATPVGDNTRVQKIESDPIDISDYYEGDIMFLRIEMDDDGPDNRDVFALSVEVNAVQWALGERLS